MSKRGHARNLLTDFLRDDCNDSSSSEQLFSEASESDSDYVQDNISEDDVTSESKALDTNSGEVALPDEFNINS